MKTNTEDSVPRSIKQTIDQDEYSDHLRNIDHGSWPHKDDHPIKDLPIGPSVYITHRWTRWFWEWCHQFSMDFLMYTTFATHMSLIVADYFEQGHLWGHSLGLTGVLLKKPWATRQHVLPPTSSLRRTILWLSARQQSSVWLYHKLIVVSREGFVRYIDLVLQVQVQIQ